MPDAKRYFANDDLDVIESVLDLVPDAGITAYASKLAKKNRISFPIVDHDGLRPLFERDQRARYKNQLITFAQAQEFFPKEFFPITSNRDFTTKLLIAFQRARMVHEHEQGRSGGSSADPEEVTVLPSPAALK